MIIGGDDKLPFYRTADTTLIANESNYASTVGGQNPLTAALATQHVLTDDIYGDDDPWPFLNRLYFTPDRSLDASSRVPPTSPARSTSSSARTV